MTLEQLIENENIEVIHAPAQCPPIEGAYTSDLLSDVMANAEDGDLLMTIQAHTNAVAVASLAGIPAILICNNRPISDDTIAAATEEGIAILRTPMSQFQASCRVGEKLGEKKMKG
jgi:hypothetical protein